MTIKKKFITTKENLSRLKNQNIPIFDPFWHKKRYITKQPLQRGGEVFCNIWIVPDVPIFCIVPSKLHNTGIFVHICKRLDVADSGLRNIGISYVKKQP